MTPTSQQSVPVLPPLSDMERVYSEPPLARNTAPAPAPTTSAVPIPRSSSVSCHPHPGGKKHKRTPLYQRSVSGHVVWTTVVPTVCCPRLPLWTVSRANCMVWLLPCSGLDDTWFYNSLFSKPILRSQIVSTQFIFFNWLVCEDFKIVSVVVKSLPATIACIMSLTLTSLGCLWI